MVSAARRRNIAGANWSKSASSAGEITTEIMIVTTMIMIMTMITDKSECK
ncbi:MAG TPA: hypothetical protein VN669_09590 [Candidatus Acidoferrales bacterium]|nr:hypothetical protein [Candidatus Acidoferrales bacterium]